MVLPVSTAVTVAESEGNWDGELIVTVGALTYPVAPVSVIESQLMLLLGATW